MNLGELYRIMNFQISSNVTTGIKQSKVKR